eukprot:scaffold11183_cov18-Tisochrysis_lutea.AAC.1
MTTLPPKQAADPWDTTCEAPQVGCPHQSFGSLLCAHMQPWYAKKPAPAAREVTEADPLIQGMHSASTLGVLFLQLWYGGNQVLAKQLGRNPIQPDRPADGASRLPDASSGLSLKPDVLALIAQQKQDSKKRSSSSSSCRSS